MKCREIKSKAFMNVYSKCAAEIDDQLIDYDGPLTTLVYKSVRGPSGMIGDRIYSLITAKIVGPLIVTINNQ